MNDSTKIAIEQIVKDCPDVKFYELDTGYELEVSSVVVDEKGKVCKVQTSDENGEVNNEYKVPEEALMITNWLPVPGVGYLRPCTLVTFRKETYYLLFGWHTNTSNQTIYSWYLEPVSTIRDPSSDNSRNYMSTPEGPRSNVCRTLYAEMIPEIENVQV